MRTTRWLAGGASVLLLGGCDGPTTPRAATGRTARVQLDAAATVPAAYTITDLAATRPAGENSVATAISSNGYIAGLVIGASSKRGFLFTNHWRDLGFANPYLTVAGVNASQTVVGAWGSTKTSSSAFVWTPATGKRTLPGPVGASAIAATGINDTGQISGCATVHGVSHMLRWSGPTHVLTDLGTGPSHRGACATAINQHGMMPVTFTSGTQPAVGMFNQAGTLVPIPLPSAPPGDTLSLTFNRGYIGSYDGAPPSPSINRYGDVAVNVSTSIGRGDISSDFFTWTGGGGSVLPPGASNLTAETNSATGLNINHIAVGFLTETRPDRQGCEHAFAYTSAGGYIVLPPLPSVAGGSSSPASGFCGPGLWGHAWAQAENNANVIAGGFDAKADGSVYHAVRWYPK